MNAVPFPGVLLTSMEPLCNSTICFTIESLIRSLPSAWIGPFVEFDEDVLQFSRRNPRSAVLDDDLQLRILLFQTDEKWEPGSGKFDGIIDQVDPHLMKQGLVSEAGSLIQIDLIDYPLVLPTVFPPTGWLCGFAHPRKIT